MEGQLFKQSRLALFGAIKPRWQLRYFPFDNKNNILSYSYDQAGIREGTEYDIECGIAVHGMHGHMTLLTPDRDINLIQRMLRHARNGIIRAPHSLGRYRRVSLPRDIVVGSSHEARAVCKVVRSECKNEGV